MTSLHNYRHPPALSAVCFKVLRVYEQSDIAYGLTSCWCGVRTDSLRL